MARTPEKKPTTWLLIRGMIRGCFHWHQFPQRLQQAFPDDQIICLDIAGNGARYAETTPASIESIAADLANQLRLTEQIKPIDKQHLNIIAISMGGMIACDLIRNHLPDHKIDSLHLINTSFANLSLPWQRMQAQAFFSFIPKVMTPGRREQAILNWTSNSETSEQRLQQWIKEAEQHPLQLKNAIAQVLAAGRYPAPRNNPIEHTFIYCSKNDRLVSPECSKKLAKHWGLPVLWHDRAGHDLPLDDPDWLVTAISKNYQECGSTA